MVRINDINLPYIISNGMVLQRNSQIKIWGEASPLTKLALTFCDKQYITVTGEDGKWEILLDTLEAGGPYVMVIECNNNKRVLQDIVIGEVWVLGGQSNMEMPFKRSLDIIEDEVPLADYPFIRKFAVPEAYNFQRPGDELSSGSWIPVTPRSVLDFSAAGYFFAKTFYEKYRIPIGLIHTAVGGTPAEAWMSEKTVMGFERFHNKLLRCKDDNYVTKVRESDEKYILDWHKRLDGKDKGLLGPVPWYSTCYIDSGWKETDLPKSFLGTELEELRGSVWFRKEFFITEESETTQAKLVLGTIINGDDTYVNGVKIGCNDSLYARRRYELPQGLIKKGKNVLAVRVIITRHMGAFVTDMPYFLKLDNKQVPLCGIWKYSVGAVMEPLAPTIAFQFMPAGVYNSMIYPLRKYIIRGVLWYQGESNTDYTKDYKDLFEALVKDWRSTWKCGEFPFLFVQLANYCPWRMEPAISKWAEIREAQRKSLEIPGTGMAVTYDAGEYNDIHPRDKKTVGNRLALLAFKLVYNENIVFSGPLFHHKKIDNDKIKLYFTHAENGLKARSGPLNGFAICGEDGKYRKAEAWIEGNTVIVSGKGIIKPVHVRYAWSDNPEEANLYNREGLPASPFTTE